MKWQASAPSNIALIKYMGKDNAELNIPSNASLSFTLEHLRCAVELELSTTKQDRWEPLTEIQHNNREEFQHSAVTTDESTKQHKNLREQKLQQHPLQLSETEQKRFLQHLTMLKKYFACDKNFIVRSAINFPTGCGLASSAASFAALTLCTYSAFQGLNLDSIKNNPISLQSLSGLSRIGSGSSCRSFFSPWSIWRGEEADAVTLPYAQLIHHTIIITADKKAVSSSAAHEYVRSSALFLGRPTRAEHRLHQLLQFFAEKDWTAAYKICWQEFWDMHALFETAENPFGYLLPKSVQVLNYLREYWVQHQDGPIVTMDAGPNIHLLFRPEQNKHIDAIISELGEGVCDFMNSLSGHFQTTAHAKWILAGEHAVLRGGPALVFPIPNKSVKLSYEETSNPVEADFDAPYGETLLMFFWGVLESGLQIANKKHTEVTGKFFWENNIPMGGGLGFSAAFCVALARWFVWRGWIDTPQLFEFARQLEDHFHGKSSGVDIAGAISDYGVFFQAGNIKHKIECVWNPELYLSHTDSVSVTAECINLVDELWRSNPELAKRIDQDMAQSVLTCERALARPPDIGFPLLVDAIKTANLCFERWGLVHSGLQNHMDQLIAAGAVAAKPTGAGSGGYILSLWREKPPQNLLMDLVPVFK